MSRRFFCPRKEKREHVVKKLMFLGRNQRNRKTMVLETQAVVYIHISIICKH